VSWEEWAKANGERTNRAAWLNAQLVRLGYVYHQKLRTTRERGFEGIRIKT
jgi:hypothetical protein